MPEEDAAQAPAGFNRAESSFNFLRNTMNGNILQAVRHGNSLRLQGARFNGCP